MSSTLSVHWHDKIPGTLHLDKIIGLSLPVAVHPSEPRAKQPLAPTARRR